jgi:ABC-type transport system substrate-binding protein
VPTGIVGEKSTDDFREQNGVLIDAAGDLNKARSLLQSAGVSGGSFGITVRNTPVELEVANYIAGVWNSLGFNVTVIDRQGKAYNDTIFNVDYDVMAYDFQAPGLDAYSVLAPFALDFSGSARPYNPEGGFYEHTPYITGFQNDAYDALIEEIFLIDDNKERHEKLKEAERRLEELSPIAPLYFNTSINITDDITSISYTKYGFPMFTKANLKNYLDYTTTEETKAFIE